MGMDDYLAENRSRTGEFGSGYKGRAKESFEENRFSGDEHEDFVDETEPVKKTGLDFLRFENVRIERDMK